MDRSKYIEKIEKSFEVHPIVAILGPRQVGKTTLARLYAHDRQATFLDLENPRDLERLENPMLALEDLEGLIVIDEIQRRPDLFPVLRVLVDRPQARQRYLILGSASRDLLRQSSETLAGRIDYMELPPFSLGEVGDLQRLLVRGGFPRSLLSPTDGGSFTWRQGYIRTFLERDIPSFGFQVPPTVIRRFWSMLAHYHAQILNLSELGVALGLSNTAIKNYLGILSGTFMVRELGAWHAHNLKKRQVKAPKIYFRDCGILNTFFAIKTFDDLMVHPKLGAIWEGFALEQIIGLHGADPESCYYWRTHNGAELDLLIDQFGQRLGFEFKYADAPKLTPSMRTAQEDLALDRLVVIFPGKDVYALTPTITAVGLEVYDQWRP